MGIQQRLFSFITRSNWALLAAASLLGLVTLPTDYALGILLGGLIVTVNFHLLCRTLTKALTPPHLSSHNVVIAKYYLRLMGTGILLLLLIKGRLVHPIGLTLGLSVVVASFFLAAAREIKNLIFKEAM